MEKIIELGGLANYLKLDAGLSGSRGAMYDKTDPRATLATPKGDAKSGSTTTPASFGLYYRDPPVEDDANGRGWYTRSQNLIVHWIEAKPGATFRRTGQVDEYMIVLPDDDTPYRGAGRGEAASSLGATGYQLLIVPPGDSRITLPKGGRVVRLFSTQSPDLNAKCANAATYAQPDPSTPSVQALACAALGFQAADV